MKSISYNNTETHRAESLACTADHRLSLSSWRCKPSLSNRRDKSRSHLIWHIRCSVHTIQDELVDLLQQMIDITHSAVGFGDEDRLIRCVLACRPTPDILLVPTSLPKRPLSYLTHFMALQSHSKLSRQLAVPRCPRIEAQQAANANKIPKADLPEESLPLPFKAVCITRDSNLWSDQSYTKRQKQSWKDRKRAPEADPLFQVAVQIQTSQCHR